MADIKIAYGTASDATITLASLASDTNLLAGRESASVSNTTDKFLDYLVSGKITTGTSPTTGRSIQVWAVGSWDGTTNHKNSICRLVAEMSTDNNSNRQYDFSSVSLREVFQGSIPPSFVFFVTHNTGVALNATAGNHQIRLQPVFETVG
jgi:hypothetical protein